MTQQHECMPFSTLDIISQDTVHLCKDEMQGQQSHCCLVNCSYTRLSFSPELSTPIKSAKTFWPTVMNAGLLCLTEQHALHVRLYQIDA